jgi:TIR domain
MVTVFCSYSHADKDILDTLLKHLQPLLRMRLIDRFVNDNRLTGGETWHARIMEHLDSAHIVLFLVTPNSVASDYVKEEIDRAVERYRSDHCRIIPIMGRAADYRGLGIDEFEPLPAKNRPIDQWPRRGDALEHVAHGVERAIFNLRNWSGPQDRLTGGQAVSGSQGRPSASVVRASKKWMPCLAAVAR